MPLVYIRIRAKYSKKDPVVGYVYGLKRALVGVKRLSRREDCA
jgi:hypothetical protein